MTAIVHGRQKSINLEFIIAFRTEYNIFASKHRFPILNACVRTHARALACINSQKICNCNTVVTFSLCSLVFLFLFHSSMPFKNDKRLKFSLAPLYNTRTHTLSFAQFQNVFRILWIVKMFVLHYVLNDFVVREKLRWRESKIWKIIVTMRPLKWTTSAAKKTYECVCHVCYSCHVSIKFDRVLLSGKCSHSDSWLLSQPLALGAITKEKHSNVKKVSLCRI